MKPESPNEDFQMQLIKFYKSELDATGTTVIEFYKKYLNENKRFPNVIDHAKQLIYMFGSTYTCEHLFLKMKYITPLMYNVPEGSDTL